MTPPTLPPEAVEAIVPVMNIGTCLTPQCPRCRQDAEAALRAAYPHLRRAILAEVMPQVVEMAREFAPDESRGGRVNYLVPRHTPASILAALEKGA